MAAEEHRQHVRMLCAGLVEIRWADDYGHLRETMANFDDLSESGACLSLDDAIAPGSPVIIGPSSHAVTAEVRYCRPFDNGWLVGLHFIPGATQDPFDCAPTHIIDPHDVPADPSLRAVPLLPPDFHSTVACMTLGGALAHEEK